MPCWASGQLDGLLFSAWFSEVSHHVKSVVIWTLSEVSRCSFCYCCIRHFRCKNVYHKLSYAMLGVRSAWWAFVFSLILRSFSPCQVGGNLNSSSSLVNWMWKVRSCVNLSFLAAKIFSYHVSSPRNPIFDHSEWLVHACLGSIRKDHWGEWSEGQRHARQTVPLPSCQSSCHRSHFKIFTRKKSTIVLKPKHTSDPAPHGFKTLAWKDFSNCCQFPHRETGSWMCCAAATFQI